MAQDNGMELMSAAPPIPLAKVWLNVLLFIIKVFVILLIKGTQFSKYSAPQLPAKYLTLIEIVYFRS
jgi:hypothetical protein